MLDHDLPIHHIISSQPCLNRTLGKTLNASEPSSFVEKSIKECESQNFVKIGDIFVFR